MNRLLQMDWIDGVLIAVFFSAGIVIDSLFPFLESIGGQLSVSGVFLAPVFRRLIFGAPNLPMPKEGVVWRFISILGLLTIFFSMGFFLLSAIAIQQSKEPMPDFRTEVEEREAELQSNLKEINAMLNAVVVPSGTPQEEIDRLQAEKKEENEREQKINIEKSIQNLETEDIQKKKDRYEEGINVLTWGVLVCFLGSFLLRIRYP
jgi:hypothetical protein